jgi:hypothetical protein
MFERAVASIALVVLAFAGAPALAAERWTGTTTAEDAGDGRCVALTFDLTTDGAIVGGTASSIGSRGHIRWQVTGRRDGAALNFDTLHRENTPDARLQQIRWTGRIAGDQMQITQNERSMSCRSPRTGVLRRS